MTLLALSGSDREPLLQSMYTEGLFTETGTLESSRYMTIRIVQSTGGYGLRKFAGYSNAMGSADVGLYMPTINRKIFGECSDSPPTSAPPTLLTCRKL